jgi:hypothetical protein
VLGYIEGGVRDGARVVAGGGQPDAFPVGYDVEPTVLAGVEQSTAVARDEIFGPVLSVLEYSDLDDAVRDGQRLRVRAARSRVHVRSRTWPWGLEAHPVGHLRGQRLRDHALRPLRGCQGVGPRAGARPRGLDSYLEPRSVNVPAELADLLARSGVPWDEV